MFEFPVAYGESAEILVYITYKCDPWCATGKTCTHAYLASGRFKMSAEPGRKSAYSTEA